MDPGIGKKNSWGTSIICQNCESEITAYVSNLGENWVAYRYNCKGCNLDGPWSDLAKGYLRWIKK